jgi:hypothetical protein
MNGKHRPPDCLLCPPRPVDFYEERVIRKQDQRGVHNDGHRRPTARPVCAVCPENLLCGAFKSFRPESIITPAQFNHSGSGRHTDPCPLASLPCRRLRVGGLHPSPLYRRSAASRAADQRQVPAARRGWSRRWGRAPLRYGRGSGRCRSRRQGRARKRCCRARRAG